MESNYDILLSNVPWGHYQTHRHGVSWATGLTLLLFYSYLGECFMNSTDIEAKLDFSLYGLNKFKDIFISKIPCNTAIL